jgi:uncharacterized protein YndB with AHSA1/START domain
MKLGGVICVAILLLTPGDYRVNPQVLTAWRQSNPNSSRNQEELLQTRKSSDKEIILTRTFAFPQETVFAAITQPAHILHWMTSAGMTLKICEVDLRAGGSFRYEFQRSNGFKIEVRGVYKTVEAPHRLVFRETYDFSPLRVLVTTTLVAKNEKTVFEQKIGYTSKRERDEDFDGVAASAAEAYANLERYLAKTRQ